MKKLILLALAAMVLGTVSAEACSVLPVSEVQQKNDLAEQVLNKLNLAVDKMSFIKFDDYYGNYLWTPMCPRGLVSGATVGVAYVEYDPQAGLSSNCYAITKIDKELVYEQGEPQYTLEVIQPGLCTTAAM